MDDTKLESTNVCVLYRFSLMAHPPHFFFSLSIVYFLLPFIGLKKGGRLIFLSKKSSHLFLDKLKRLCIYTVT